MKEKVYTNNGNIMYIYNVMKKYSDINNPLTVNDIITLIKKQYNENISSRTIRRNFKVLEEKFNITIGKENDRYYIDYEEEDFDSSEIRCLVDMVNYSRFVDEKLANTLTYKLINLLNENDKKDFSEYEKYMKNTKTNNKELFYTIKTLSEAIINKQHISFDYYKYNLKKEYEFRKSFLNFPLTIFCEMGQYYLISSDSDKNLFYFRLDRIKNIELKNGKPITISKQKINEYIYSTVGMYGGEKRKIKAIVKNNLLDDVIEQFGKDTLLKAYNKDNFEMETEVNLEGFKHWALRHLEEVKVIFPKDLKEEILKILIDAKANYESKI